MTTVGLLHPGDMGATVGAAARAGGARVVWASQGRSGATRDRASETGLEDLGTLDALVGASDVILSVCPPHSARAVARDVAARGFRGLFVDGNAVAPVTAREIGAIVEAAGATFVDGGIIGPPARTAGTTRLYLSGRKAPEIAALFTRGLLEAIVLDSGPFAASAVKTAYAGWNKAAQALLMAVRAQAVADGVDEALLAEWARSQPDLAKRSENAARGSAPKAWRWVGEMEEIATAFAAAGLPEGFHLAAAEIFTRLAGYKDAPAPPSAAEVARALTRSDRPHSSGR